MATIVAQIKNGKAVISVNGKAHLLKADGVSRGKSPKFHAESADFIGTVWNTGKVKTGKVVLSENGKSRRGTYRKYLAEGKDIIATALIRRKGR